MDVSELFWNASLDELKRGYAQIEDQYICLLCGEKAERGIIYPDEGILYEAERYVRVHIEKVHQSVFEFLIQLDKKLTGLTDHQSHILALFYQGKSDTEIQQEMNIGSVSTIRNHRFVLKEKERQAKVFLTMMELLKEKENHIKNRKVADDHSNVKQDDDANVLNRYFPEGTMGVLKAFPRREKQKLVILREIVKRFDSERIYDEKEINQILQQVYPDHVTLRRYLIDYGFLRRKADGSEYWVNVDRDGTGEGKMDRKKELKQLYKESKTNAGVYQIKNIQNQKILVESTRNLNTINGKLFMLKMGNHENKLLQEEWKKYGEDAFVVEVLETLKEKEEGYFDAKEELKKLERKWLDKLKPFGERGYNRENSR